jgi:hypothetical protein
MTKPELITKIAEKTNLSKKDAAAAMGSRPSHQQYGGADQLLRARGIDA